MAVMGENEKLRRPHKKTFDLVLRDNGYEDLVVAVANGVAYDPSIIQAIKACEYRADPQNIM